VEVLVDTNIWHLAFRRPKGQINDIERDLSRVARGSDSG
jgi:hypothetical protein